jgi:hypothetical protein
MVRCSAKQKKPFLSCEKFMKSNAAKLAFAALMLLFSMFSSRSSTNVYLVDVPDYAWYYGCMGTTSGNLMGFWDRHGFPDFYTGLLNGGLAPLNTVGANSNITSMWASKAGVDGRPANQMGHLDDYWVDFQNTGPDPFVAAGRAEHAADCLADFLGMNQSKWTNLANECNGNIDGFCFVYWETNGLKRVNFSPDATAGTPAVDVQSGLRKWTQSRGYDANVFSQLTDFNTAKPADAGFTYEDMKAEIDAGYPVILFLQGFTNYFRNIGSAAKVNPLIHAMVAYGYYINDSGTRYVRYKTSWADGPNVLSVWGRQNWQATLPVRGVIGFRPLPKIKRCAIEQGKLSLQWDGPAADLYDSSRGGINRIHGYVVEMSPSLSAPLFSEISPILLTNRFEVADSPTPAFYRVKLVKP